MRQTNSVPQRIASLTADGVLIAPSFLDGVPASSPDQMFLFGPLAALNMYGLVASSIQEIAPMRFSDGSYAVAGDGTYIQAA
jgi:hypothetical protein